MYFVLWHTADSITRQIAHLRQFRRYHFIKWVKDALPFTGIAISGFLILLLFLDLDSLRQYAGYAFILISAIALPHTLIMDRVYEQGYDSRDTRSATIL